MATEQQAKDFIYKIAPIIQKLCAEKGYRYPSAIIAQACCESGYGTSSLAYKYHNYFGMKCGSSWKGKSVNMNTKEEYSQGVLTSIKDNFRVYDSMEDGVRGYFDFISTQRYQNLKNACSSKNYIEIIKNDGYATSFSYVNTVYGIVQKYMLTQYDGNSVQAKSVNPQIVREVLEGKHGNGAVRQANLAALGYTYSEVQKKINEILTLAEVLYSHKKALGDYWEVTLEQIKE